MDSGTLTLIGLLVGGLFEVVGVLSAVHAIMSVRTSQGAIAWAICLCLFPFLALPLYWVLGRDRFRGYVKARRAGNTEMHDVVHQLAENARGQDVIRDDHDGEHRVLAELARMPFTKHNHVELLIDGEATFDAIFAEIAAAEQYIVVQFFIVHDDTLGREFKSRLVRKAEDGVRVYFLYDEIGSHKLPRRYLRALREAGITVSPFYSTKGPRNRFQLNFRNHRKIVVVDGRRAYVGGLNVGDKYMGRSERFGPWRDTHVQIEGPAVHAVQLSFLEDWYWATNEIPDLDWSPRLAEEGDQDVLVLPTGPADRMETCSMFFVHLINRAKRRVWIASPYFVPDQHVVAALQLAALRGVEVRVMLPQKPDHLLVYLSGFTYLEETEGAGVQFYRYQKGFMHHKVILVDEDLAAVGTANFDNRSFRLNFEITILVDDAGFNQEVAEMLTRDFENCRKVLAHDYRRRPFLFRFAARAARLMAPVQ